MAQYLKDIFLWKEYLKWDVLLERSEAGLSFLYVIYS